MKYILVIYEGAADVPTDELEGDTPLGLARNVYATSLVNRGVCGTLEWPVSDSAGRLEYALATVLGVSPDEARALRRGPVEAAGTRLDPATWTYAYRGNYVPSDGQELKESRVSGLSFDETEWLTDVVGKSLAEKAIAVEAIGSARVVMVFDQLKGKIDPGEFPSVGHAVEFNREDVGGEKLSYREVVMKCTRELLEKQPINEVRLDLGENPANLIWLWGGGPPVAVSRPFAGAPVKAAMVTNSSLARGMARLCRMSCLELGDVWADVPKPELIGLQDLSRCIDGHDLTVVYAESPGEGGTYGSPVEKVKAIDRLDIHVLGRVLDAAEQIQNVRVMLMALPAEGMHLDETPVLLSGSSITADASGRWNEDLCSKGSLGSLPADRILTKLLGD